MGGAKTHLGKFIPALVRERPDWEVHVFLSQNADPLAVANVVCHRVGSSGAKRLLWDAIGVGRAAVELNADVIVNLANYGPIGCGVPSILYQRNSLYFDLGWIERMEWRWRVGAWARRMLAFMEMRSAAVVIVPSAAMREFLRSWRWCPRRVLVEVVPHGVDSDQLAFKPMPVSGRLRLVALGHGAPHKNQEMLIRIVDVLVRSGVDVVLEASIADDDDPEYVGMLRGLIGRSGLQERVRLVGRVNASEFLASGGIAVSCSITESFGFPVAEAMAAGVAVVSSAIPAAVELLDGNGLVFDPDSASSAATAILQVVAMSEAEKGEMLRRARARVEAFTWEGNVRDVVRVIERVGVV